MEYELVYKNKEPLDNVLNTKPAKLELKESVGTQTSLADTDWKNMLLYGDNLPILKTLTLNEKIKGKVSLVYIDPPFATNQQFGNREQEEAYSDYIVGAEFIEFIRKRLILIRELLSEDGSIYLHLDQKKGHYIKVIMDEVFGEENFINDITRIKCNPKNFQRKGYGNVKDVIYFYSRTDHDAEKMIWNDFRLPLSEEEVMKQFPKVDKDNRRYATTPLHARGETKNGVTGKPWRGMMPPKGRHWRVPPDELEDLDKKGLIEWSSTGNPRKKIFAEDNKGKKIQDVWEFKDNGIEGEHYATEKNLEMLKIILKMSSRPNDLVMDCFAGSGTTLLAAEELGRRWIAIDSSEKSINAIKNRFSEITHKSFNLYAVL
jgi:adenine-specific DNA-methyltransferase